MAMQMILYNCFLKHFTENNKYDFKYYSVIILRKRFEAVCFFPQVHYLASQLSGTEKDYSQ